MQLIQRQLLDDGICILTFDRPDSSANIFDRATLEELDAHLHPIAAPEMGARGLILRSAKPNIFVAGADLRAIQRMSPSELESFISLGQSVMRKLASLKMPTVAAIHGAAVGGGCEVALACDWRVASPEKATKIGLPETQLGILPAWGGSTRLPRLIGLPAALDIILGGKTLAANAALKRGLVDLIAPADHLVDAARELLKRGKRPHDWKTSGLALTAMGALASGKARTETLKRTRGHYPAPLKAAEVAIKASAAKTAEESDKIERDAVLELSRTPEAENLIRLFFLQERAKKITVEGAAAPTKIGAAAVIGAGVMGSAIAQWLSARGIRVILRDVDPDRVAAGMANIAALYEEGVKRHTFTKLEARRGMDLVSPAPWESPLQRADLVIEAAVEKMDIKKTIFQRLDDLTRADCILATNTSALSITELARATRHPERVLGLHFFNPVHKMQLVEVVVGKDADPSRVQGLVSFVQGIGKLPVVVRDSPGFLVNRILLPYMIEAAHLFWAGASVHDIDEAMLDFGMPMGPLRLTDEVGVDVAEDVARTLVAAFPERLKIPAALPHLLEKGRRGKKSGAGFYEYGGKDPSPMKSRPRGPRAFTREELQRRMVLLMINEAARCLEEKIVDKPEDVDFAMVMGTGFAPFRGGPLRAADALGISRIAQELTELEVKESPQYAPSALLVEYARANKRFYEN